MSFCVICMDNNRNPQYEGLEIRSSKILIESKYMYDVNILVNGSRCKQYFHDGKTFIEAKDGSEYTIEIKNNSLTRILAVCSVDGLDILTGKKAEGNNPGYVIDGYSNGKFDGFRVSDEKVAKFVFNSKGESYAASKKDGSEQNVGVIGVRLFREKAKPAPTQIHHYHNTVIHRDIYPYQPDIIWSSNNLTNATVTFGSTTNTLKGSGELKARSANVNNDICDSYCCDMSDDIGNDNVRKFMSSTEPQLKSAEPLRGFDMGTSWGEAKESKVIEVEFERGMLALSTEIFYASRESLLEMGVPLKSEKKVNYPSAFADSKYATPPSGWRG